jgi:hypothetical protein
MRICNTRCIFDHKKHQDLLQREQALCREFESGLRTNGGGNLGAILLCLVALIPGDMLVIHFWEFYGPYQERIQEIENTKLAINRVH